MSTGLHADLIWNGRWRPFDSIPRANRVGLSVLPDGAGGEAREGGIAGVSKLVDEPDARRVVAVGRQVLDQPEQPHRHGWIVGSGVARRPSACGGGCRRRFVVDRDVVDEAALRILAKRPFQRRALLAIDFVAERLEDGSV